MSIGKILATIVITLGIGGCASPKYLTNHINLGYGYTGTLEAGVSLHIAQSLEEGNYILNGKLYGNLPESSFGYSVFSLKDKETGNELKIFVDKEDLIDSNGRIKPLHLRTLQNADINLINDIISEEEGNKYWMSIAFRIMKRDDILDILNE